MGRFDALGLSLLMVALQGCDQGSAGFELEASCDGGGKCDEADGEAVARPLGVWVVARFPAGVDELAAAEALTERVVGKRSWEVGRFDEQTIGVNLEPGETLWFMEVTRGEIDRLAAAGVDWEARLWRMTEALRRDPWTVDDDRTRPVLVGGVEPRRPEHPDQGWLRIDDPAWFTTDEHGIRLETAWAMFDAVGRSPGQGALVAHPDTGILPCPELGTTAVLLDEGLNVEGGNTRPGADDIFPSDFNLIENFGHGTRTASLIVSPPGRDEGTIGELGATGVAPGAHLVPIRFNDAVLVTSASEADLARGIEAAVDMGAHVVSLSVGGEILADGRLREAVRTAAHAGVIVVAAAGNGTGALTHVTEPAEYPETIAVTASNAWGGTWAGANFGAAVDIAAPGEDVRHGRPARLGNTARDVAFDTQSGVGTSLSTAIVAGVAALWTSFHTPETLQATYCDDEDCSAIVAAFLRILETSGHTVPPGWNGDGKHYGVGIIDAAGVLEAPLPTMCRNPQARLGWDAC